MSHTAPTFELMDRVRLVAATILFLAALGAGAGTVLDWVTIDPPPKVPEDQAERAEPFNGLDTDDGIYVLGAALVMAGAAFRVVQTQRSGAAILGALASVVAGAVAFADYRAVDDPESGLMRAMEPIGEVDPGAGLTLIGVAGVLGVVAAVAAAAASPAPVEE